MGNIGRRARRQAERDQKRHGQPPSWDPDVVPQLTIQQRAELANFHDKVKVAQREASIDLINRGAPAEVLAVNAGGFAEDLFRKSAGKKHWKCIEGCSWCCHQQVSVTPVEAINIATNMRKALAEDWFKTVRDSVAEKAAIIAKFTNANQYDQARVACAMLTDGRCSIYSSRPILCRSYASFAVESCKAYYDQPDKGYAHLDEFARHVGLGVLGGVKDASTTTGRDGNIYEFHSALLRALDIPDVAERWARGEKIFEGCKLSMWYQQVDGA